MYWQLLIIGAVTQLAQASKVDQCFSIAKPISGAPANISETNLKTYTYYSLRLPKHPHSIITWGYQYHSSGAKFVQVDRFAFADYGRSGSRYFDGQWQFIPSDDVFGWYELINCGSQGKYAKVITSNGGKMFAENATPSAIETIDKYYVLLDFTYSHNSLIPEDRTRFLWKPIGPINYHKGRPIYQIKSKALPNGIIAGVDFENGIYLVVDDTDDISTKHGHGLYIETDANAGGVNNIRSCVVVVVAILHFIELLTNFSYFFPH